MIISIRKISLYTLLGMSLLMAACGNKGQAPQGPPAVSVSVQPVTTTNASYYEEYPATVRALNEVELRPQVNGYITGIYFKEGQKVKKGQKLYTIDQQLSEANYKQAQANLSLQEANLEKAKKDVERYRSLDKQDAIAKQQVDYAEATYAAAQQQVEAAKATVRGVQTNVRYATIIAPFDGTIGVSLVRLGASVSPGQTLLNTISSDDPVAVDIAIDQSEIYRFTKLLNKKISKGDSTFRLAFRNELYPAAGKISFIDRAVDPQTGTIRMRLEFPNADHSLRAGMSGALRVLSDPTEKTVVIPYKAINEQLGEFFVYVPDSSKATQRKVILGKQVGKNVIIRDGLNEGDTIITEGIQNLREGTAIRVGSPSPTTTATTKK
jgi:membrane fusion protein (multidrug efflux system)